MDIGKCGYWYIMPKWNYQGLNAIFLRMMAFAIVAGSSFVWFWTVPGIASVLAIVSSITGWFFSYKAYYNPYKSDDVKLKSQVYLLNSVETDLKHLIKFIQEQRDAVLSNEKTLSELRREREQLEPIVDSNRDLVKAIIAQANRIDRKRIIYGYIASFLLGFASSLLASFIFGLFKPN
jgi:hypothetical protein